MKAGVFLLTFLILISLTANALAIQEHNYLGWYTHQIGHIFFFFGLLIAVIYIARYFKPIPRVWKLFVASLVLWLLWNVLTFTGHMVAPHVQVEDYILKTFNTYAMIWLFVKVAEPLVNLIAMR